MALEVSTPAQGAPAAGTGIPAAAPAAGGAPADGAPQYATAADLAKIAGDTKALFGRLNKAITDLQTQLASPVADDAEDADEGQPDGAPVPPSLKAAKTRIKREEASLATQREAVQLAAERTAIATQLQAAGANPALIDLAVDGLISRNRKAISVETGELGEQTFHVRTAEGTLTVNDFVKDFLGSERGKALIVPKKAPALPGSGGGVPGGRIQLKMIDALGMKADDLKSGKYEIVD